MRWRTHYSPIGLDIGTHQVKMVQLKGKPTRWAMHDIAVGSLPAAPGEATPMDTEQIVHCVRDLLAAGAFVGNTVISVLPCSEVDIRTIRVSSPETAEDKHEVIRREADAYLPYNIDEAILDAIRVGKAHEEEADKQQWILVATRRHQVDAHLDLLGAAGLQCVALDVQPLALSRLVRHSPHLSTGTPLLMVDMGCHYSTAFVLWRDVLIYNRTFAWGGTLLTQALMKDLELDHERAELLKQQYGIDPQATAHHTLTDTNHRVNVRAMPGLIYEIVRPHLEHLVQELERILAFGGAQVHGATIERVLLCGGSAALKKLDTYLHQRLGINVAVTEPWRHLGGAADNRQDPPWQSLCTPVVATALGLALRGRS